MKPLAALLPVLVAPLSSVAEDDPRWVDYAAKDGPGAGAHVVLVSGDEEYRSEEALPMLAKILAERHGFRCTVLFAQNQKGEIDPDARGNIPGLAALADADLMVLFTRFRELPDEDMRHVVEYVESGRPLIGIRTATHAFAYREGSTSEYAHWRWNDTTWRGGFGKQVLGETWVNHHGRHGSESTRGVIAEGAEEHPILRGVEDVWGPTDVYGIRTLPDDAVVLLEGSVRTGMTPGSPEAPDERNRPRMPVTWVRERQVEGAEAPQRVLCTTIGAATDFESEDLRRLFVNACLWCVGREDKIPDKADATIVGEYDPTPFGFGKFVPGRRPKDHTLDAKTTSGG